MKYGFMLIELIVATMIAAMIGTLLLTALSQETRFQQTIDMMVDTTIRVGIITNQLEKDFMGAFIPVQARLKEEADEDDESGETKKGAGDQKKEAAPKKDEKKAQSQEEKQEKTKKPAEKPLEKIFYATTKGGALDMLTFITNNPMGAFVAKDVGTVKPKLVRVQYTLKQENEKDKNSPFVLVRQENTELDLSKATTARSYEIIHGIKELSITYVARIKKEDENAKKAAPQKGAEKKEQKKQPQKKSEQKEKIQYEYKRLKEWVSEPPEKEKAIEQEEKNFPRIPHMIEVTMSLWNMQQTKAEDFVLLFELPINTDTVQEEQKTEKPEEKKQKEASKVQKEAGKGQENLLASLSKTLGNITKMLNA